MPAWLISALLKYALPVILSFLAKTEAAKEVEALAGKVGLQVLTSAEGVKTYYAPTDFPNPSPSETQNNFNK